MNLSDYQQRALIRIIERGVDRSTEKLAQMTRTHWDLSTVSVSVGASDGIQSLIGTAPWDHHGAYFSAPGASFLVLFPKESGRSVTRAYAGATAAGSKIADIEKVAINEVSNILVNAVAAVLADTMNATLILSAPVMLEGSKAEILNQAMRLSQAGKGFVLMSYISMSSFDLSADCVVVLILQATLLSDLLKALELSS